MNLLQRFKKKVQKTQEQKDAETVGGRLDPVDDTWDMVLNYLLDNHEIVKVDQHTVTFNNKAEVWVANKWYSYGRPHSPHALNVLPTPTTAIKLHNLIKNKQMETLKMNIEAFKA